MASAVRVDGWPQAYRLLFKEFNMGLSIYFLCKAQKNALF